MRSAWAPACSWLSLPFSTSLAVWRCVTSRAFSSPASTYLWSTSLSRTGTSADAITWAISPPMTPAPTTAALKTNMRPDLSSVPAAELPLGRELHREPAQRALQAVAGPPAQQQALDRRQRGLGLERDLERDPRLLQPGLEDHLAHAGELLVLGLQRLAEPRLVARHPLPVAPAAARPRHPLQRAAAQRPVVRERDDLAELLDPRRPAGLVVPELLGLHGPALHHDGGGDGTHHGSKSTFTACAFRSTRSRRTSRRAFTSPAVRPA